MWRLRADWWVWKPPGDGVGGKAGTRREGDGSAGVVAVISSGEEAFDDAFNAGNTLGQGLDFLSQGLIVGARVTPNGQQQANQGGAYGQDSDEFRGSQTAPWWWSLSTPPAWAGR